MLTLQVQHFALYPLVGREGFARYIQANNRAAVFPAILAAVLVFALSVVLLFDRPGFVPTWSALVAVVFNVVNMMSTMIWHGRLHGVLAATGYDEKGVRLLIRTNWIRTAALLAQAVLDAVLRVPRHLRCCVERFAEALLERSGGSQ
jgi:hypothetical protein